MKNVLLCLAGIGLLATAQLGAADTWKGTISDSSCAAKHSAEKHGDSAQKHEDCVRKCVEGGSKYVFLAEGKVFKIANQDFADLKVHAGHEVSLTGEIKDDVITVAKIEAPKK